MKLLPLVLVAVSGKRRSELLRYLQSIDAEILAVETCRQVRELVAMHPVDLVIVEVSLPDGNWCDILKHLVDHNTHPRVVVTTAVPTESLWSEVIWRGAHDVLVEPYNAQEVQYVVRSALRAAGPVSSQFHPLGQATMR